MARSVVLLSSAAAGVRDTQWHAATNRELPEPVEVVIATRLVGAVRVIGGGLQTGAFVERVFDPSQLAAFTLLSKGPTFDDDGLRFKLGVEATRLGLA